MNGRLVPAGRPLTALPTFDNKALKQVHAEYILKARDSMMNDPSAVRDISGITAATNLKKLPEAVRRIKVFRRTLAEFLKDENPDAVFRLNVQLFPLVRENE